MTATSNKKKAVERLRDKARGSAGSGAKNTVGPSHYQKLNFSKPNTFRLVLFFFGIVVVYLQIILWIGEGSLAEVWRLKKSISVVEQENEKLQARNQELIDEVEALRTGLDLIEHRAREDLGLVKKNEMFYHVIDRRSETEKNPSIKNRLNK